MLLVVPFLKLQTSVKLTLVPVIIIVGEVAFWAGTFFLGKELVKRYRNYLNPLRWFRKKAEAESGTLNNAVIRMMEDSDSVLVLEIYRMGIETKNSTFEINVPSWQEWKVNHLDHSRFVAEIEGVVAGWVALSPVSKRDAYKGVAEISVYVHRAARGMGLGTLLMKKVIDSSEDNGIWTLSAVVFPENKASVLLHRKHGFRVIGTREKISLIDGIWRDTVLLERRSKKLGV
jgi:L-amino acid N-acyltransferase YncA